MLVLPALIIFVPRKLPFHPLHQNLVLSDFLLLGAKNRSWKPYTGASSTPQMDSFGFKCPQIINVISIHIFNCIFLPRYLPRTWECYLLPCWVWSYCWRSLLWRLNLSILSLWWNKGQILLVCWGDNRRGILCSKLTGKGGIFRDLISEQDWCLRRQFNMYWGHLYWYD